MRVRDVVRRAEGTRCEKWRGHGAESRGETVRKAEERLCGEQRGHGAKIVPEN